MSLNNIILEYRKDIIRMSLGSPALKKSINTSLKKALESGLIRNIDKNGKKLLTGADVLNAYKLGNLSRGANAKVVKYLFQSVDDINFKTTIAKKMMGESQNIVKYSKLTSQQATTELKKLGYNPEEIKLLKSVFTNQGKTNNYGFKKPGTITPTTTTTTTTTTTPTWTDIKYWQGGNVIKWSDDEIKSFLNIKRPIHEKIRNYFILFTKDIKKAKENLKKLFDARKNTTDTALRNKIDEKIINEFKILSNAKQKTFKEITSVLDEVGTEDKVWRETWNKIKGQNSDLFKSLSDPADKTYFYQKTFKFLGEVLFDFLDVLKATYNIIGKKIKLPFKTREGGFKNVFLTGARIGLPRKNINTLYNNTFKYGGTTAAYSRYAVNLALSTIVFNLTLSFLNNILDGVANLSYWDDIIGYSEELKRGESGPYTEKMKNLNMVQKFLVRRALNYRTTEEEETNFFKKVLLDAVTTKVKENGWDNMLQYTKYIPGRTDDIVYIIVSTVNTFIKAIDDLKYREQFISNLKSDITRVKKETEDKERQLEVEVERVQERIQTTKPGGTLEDFKETHSDPNAKDLGNGIYQVSDGRNFKWNGEYYEMQ